MKCMNVVILIILILSTVITGLAQSNDYKFELGVQASAFKGPDKMGGGFRIGYNFNKYLEVEGEVNLYANAGRNDRATQAQFGVKTGINLGKIGFYGKVRPGFIQNNRTIYYRTIYYCPEACIQLASPPRATLSTFRAYPNFAPYRIKSTNFSLDVGGVVEFNPTRRFFVRIDVGDTIAQHYYWYGVTHNLQVTTGVGLRF